MSRIEPAAALDADQQAAVRALADRLEGEIGAPQLNDQTLAQLGASRDGLVHLLAHSSQRIDGYAQLEGRSAELAAPEPLAADLLQAVEAAAPGPLTIWTHGTNSPIATVLDRAGYRRTRLLHQLRMPLDIALDNVPVPPDVDVRPFVVGADEPAWVQINAAAFAEHAEQGAWTVEDLAAREVESWFDPAGFFLAWRGSELVAFHWTKIHPDGLGEVYVLGVAPRAQGLRLGAALLSIGLRHLHERGCPEVLLYVDDSNTAAMRLYERFGFRRHDEDAQWHATGSGAVQAR